MPTFVLCTYTHEIFHDCEFQQFQGGIMLDVNKPEDILPQFEQRVLGLKNVRLLSILPENGARFFDKKRR